ncbi:MAG: winged helix-turn-helix transcriptional regulator [Rhizobacter sp.]|nr:winged helix-turn-helix transcriptional regulator [Ferruginibacter sp.]
MPDTRNLLSGKPKYLYGSLLLMFISLICVAFSMAGSNDFDIARREILIRRIGHELLLHSGDSTSRVLPVKKVTENEYRVSFENAFTFEPDFLVKTTQRLLAKDPLGSDYVVNVLNCANANVAYGYAISKNKNDDIVACVGRSQPLACYMINIKFKTTGIITAKNGYLLGSLPFLAFVGFILLRSDKTQKALPGSKTTGMFTLGSMSFETDTRKLVKDEKTIDLTRTETRVLRIFALSPNEVVERSRLQKEIWEEEGVIVGRSLDMFISKLRKKLELDPAIKIVVIRGKGYKLEISA